jgi:PhoPQ-activated pathogenicity-related protein
MPTLTWKWAEDKLSCETSGSGLPVVAIRNWFAESDSRDFRKSRWAAKEKVTPEDPNAPPVFAILNQPPEKGYTASFVEYEFKTDAGPLYLCTQIQIREAKKK